MKKEILTSEKHTHHFQLDPRTKLLLLLMISIFTIGGAGGQPLSWAAFTLGILPAIGLLVSGKKKVFLIFMGLYLLGIGIQYGLLSKLSGILNFIALASAGIFSQFMPGLMMGYFAVSTTTVSEFIAAMEKLHMPRQLTISLSVMFRFFPTVAEEASSISDAMAMRGISLGGKHPGRMLEYRLVPLMTCSVKIGEELSAASLTRGLGAPIKRTNLCRIHLGIIDVLVIILCMIILLNWMMVSIGGIWIK